MEAFLSKKQEDTAKETQNRAAAQSSLEDSANALGGVGAGASAAAGVNKSSSAEDQAYLAAACSIHKA